MKVNKVNKIYRPMRVWFRNIKTLFYDIFYPGESTHGWIRYPLNVKNKYQQTKVLKVIKKSIIKKQTITNDSSKRQQ
tara:strand:- start:4394 stop:4624 length:231 start_codon:yes stop_codon:yes gene_type:complete